jgi:hypothetical protein
MGTLSSFETLLRMYEATRYHKAEENMSPLLLTFQT